jgi:1-acyl-sn-glycerol-3-phosphate acyltransferase
MTRAEVRARSPIGGDPIRARLESLRDATEAELRRRSDPRPSSPATNGRHGWPSVLSTLAQALPRLDITSRLPRRDALKDELSMAAMSATGSLALRLRALTGRDVIDLESLQDLLGFFYRAAAVRESHKDGLQPMDDFGFDQEWTEAMLPLARLMYRKYWRVDTAGASNVPRRGGALLVSNHSGVLPLDGAMIKVALFEEGLDRHARALIASWFFTLPVLNWFLRRSGQTLGHPDDSIRLLRDGQLVLVFPEGVRGTGKPFRERYQLRRFGRGGFVEVAIRAGVPIVPISVVGAEEIYPMLLDLAPLARLIGFPYFPLTPTWPWLGPLGLVPLPSKWRIEFFEPVRTDELDAGDADDPSLVMRIADEVRDTIQQGLINNLMERRSVFRR